MEWESYPSDETLEMLRGIVTKYFNVYDASQQDGVIAFHVDIPSDEEILHEKFNILRQELKKYNFIPLIRKKAGEYLIFLVYHRKKKEKPIWINLLLLITTLVTTTLSGALMFSDGSWQGMLAIKNISQGFIFFSFPLLSILGIHEMGHFYASKKHGVAASLPFFIPIPPNNMLPLGTMGAVISMREPIPDRKSLLDIGIAGPLAGFIVAIPVLIIGLYLSHPISSSSIPKGTPSLGPNLLILALIKIMFPHLPHGYTINLHPTAFAGWVGLVVTAINLLPAGQLDGGHIARAVLKEKHLYASFAAIALLAVISFIGNGSWLFMLLIIIFLIGPGHPPALNELLPLDRTRIILAAIALIIFALSFTPIPIY